MHISGEDQGDAHVCVHPSLREAAVLVDCLNAKGPIPPKCGTLEVPNHESGPP